MSDLTKKASYIRGLADGLDFDAKSDEGKIITRLLELTEAMTEEIDDLEGRVSDMEDFMYEMARDLSEVVDDLHGDDGDDYDDFLDDEDDDDYDEYEDDLYEIECPHCHEDVMIEFDMLDEDNAIICPNCHEKIPLEFDFDDDYEED